MRPAGPAAPQRCLALRPCRRAPLCFGGGSTTADAPPLVPQSNVRTALQASYLAGLTAAYLWHALDLAQLAAVVLATALLLALDAVAARGGLEALAVDSAGRLLSPTYGRRVALHEAAHFLVSYLMGM